ncbi:DUF4232 domain-containing protein [Streptomyces odontomachi]|uniref:DUF4232 domain-containing protein n=1 Tax=Streptomyces odontomachi TaxID=2944940 RepID=UPI002109545C|nr:DUF4232 domain-containing protein [Streptomyces sp. ODS25]
MRVQKITLAALALAASLSLTACQGDDDAAGANDSASSAASSGGSTDQTSGGSDASDDSGSGSDTSSAGESADGGSADGSGGGQVTTGTCKTANLAFSSSHGMGEGELIISLKNTGEACSLKGFPGVDLMSQDTSEPLSANRSTLAAPGVALQTGDTTRFTLHYPPNNSGGTGVYVSALHVTPPNETHYKALSVSFSVPVSADTGDKVMVDPVGTGKQ